MLIDAFARKLDYLRLSITDRCNFRCLHCMPPEGVEWKPHDAMLSFEEIFRLCGILAGLGIKKIRVTGGEPLVRKGIAPFFKKLKSLEGIEKVTLTTNGFFLGAYLDEAAALEPPSLPDGVNISLNALDGKRYGQITRSSGVNPRDILAQVDRLLAMNIPVKINCVPMRGVNEDEIIPLTALARDKNIAVRFIELMPLGTGADHAPVTGGETMAIIEKAFGSLTPFTGAQGSGPAVYFSLSGFAGKTGFINPVSKGFCESCNRLRLTSEGKLKLCLSSEQGLDLRELLRTGAPDSEIAGAITETVAGKPHYHNFSAVYGASPSEIRAGHSGGMSGIGG